MSVSLDYIAGFFDGEGLAAIYQLRKPAIVVFNNCLEVLQRIRDALGCGRIHKKSKRNPRQNDCYELHIKRAEDCLRVGRLLIPLTIVKRRVLEKLVERLEVLGVKSKKPYHRGFIATVEELRTWYYAQGLSGKQIARKLGVSDASIYSRMAKLGVARRGFRDAQLRPRMGV